MDLYLVGHGYIVRDVPAITVPQGFTLQFYCKEDTEFDSTWEAAVASGAARQDGYSPVQGRGQFEVTRVGPGATCADHLLTRPGGMKTLKPLAAMKEIRTNVAKGSMIGVPLEDKDTLCIKGGGKLMTGGYMDGLTYTYLSDILFALQQRVPGGATIHWGACRSTDTSRRDIEDQARGAWGGLQK